jgi:DNA-binding MarR family transcriptional regulator
VRKSGIRAQHLANFRHLACGDGFQELRLGVLGQSLRLRSDQRQEDCKNHPVHDILLCVATLIVSLANYILKGRDGTSSKISLRVAEAVHGASIRVLRVLRAEDVKSGVGPAQLSALSILTFMGPKTMGELAEAEQVKPPTMSRIVDGLVRQRLAQRTTETADRRSLRIAATPRGKRLLLKGRNRRVRALAKRLDRLSESDLTVLENAAKLLGTI